MTRALRIAVADDESFMLDYYREILPSLGHEVVAAASTGEELARLARDVRPELIITDIRMPGADGIEAAMAVCPELSAPVILVSAFYDDELIRRAETDHIMAFLVKPIKKPDLATTIALALHRFEQFQAMRREAADLRQALADRKVIERAKGLLMKTTGLDEPEAFRRLQKLARDSNRKLVEVGQAILLAEEALHPDAGRGPRRE
jgi:response regulator NasT